MSPHVGRAMAGRRADERGVAAPLVVALTGLVLVLCLAGAALGRLLVDQRRTASAADLAALAGAGALQRGADACTAARASAGRNGAELTSCTVSGEQVLVTAAIRTELLGRLDRTVTLQATARAGPVSAAAEQGVQ